MAPMEVGLGGLGLRRAWLGRGRRSEANLRVVLKVVGLRAACWAEQSGGGVEGGLLG